MQAGNQCMRRERGGGSKAMPSDQSHGNHDEHGNPHGQSAGVVQPLADIKSNDVHEGYGRQGDQGKRDEEGWGVGQVDPSPLVHVKSIATREIEDGGKVGQVAGPVGPASHESGEVAEGTLAPDIKPTLVGIAGRELNY